MLRPYNATQVGVLCSERGWSRQRLIRALRQAAKPLGRELPDDDNLSRMIRQWISGDRGLSEFYAGLLSTVFGVTFVKGRVVEAVAEPSRRNALAAAAVVLATARQSTSLIERLAASVDSIAIDQFADDVNRLSIEYMASPPALIVEEAKLLRDSIMVALDHARRPSQIQDLYLLAGQAGGILTYAALDLGNASAAMANARSALVCADLAGHTDLTSWTRGTQSLIARFAKRYKEAEGFLIEGMKAKPRGIGLSRLASGMAQCRAHFGDADGTHAALKLASESHLQATDDETTMGLFGFPRSKVHFYAASSLIWLPDRNAARLAANESATAIELFQTGPAEELFVADAVLARIYGATAHVRYGDIGKASEIIDPIFLTADQQRVSWHKQRLSRLVEHLGAPSLQQSREAAELKIRLSNF